MDRAKQQQQLLYPGVYRPQNNSNEVNHKINFSRTILYFVIFSRYKHSIFDQGGTKLKYVLFIANKPFGSSQPYILEHAAINSTASPHAGKFRLKPIVF